MAHRSEIPARLETYDSQLALLRRGCRAAGWACRDLLGLTENVYAGEVLARLNDQLGRLNVMSNRDDCEMGVAYTVAAAVLLRNAPTL